MDFIIGRYALDNPEEGRMIRPDLFEMRESQTERIAEWAETLPEDELKNRMGLNNPVIKDILNRKR